MIRRRALVREAARRIAGAADRTCRALAEGQVQQEPAFTDRMLGRIEQAMNGFRSRGVRWTAMTLTDHGPGAQERQYGADFAGVLSVALQDYSVRKGFLAQAKLIEPGVTMSASERTRLQRQCGQMLELTGEAFVFLYARGGVSVVPAAAVFGARLDNPHELYAQSIARFFERHFECFVGDVRLHVAHVSALEELRARVDARHLLHLGVGE